MGRLARIVVPGMPHHVTQRGNRRMETFFGEDDYRAHLSLMGEWCRRYNVAAWAYCLHRCEGTGRPLGDETFLRKLGGVLGRSLLPGRPGRPRKGSGSRK